MGKKGFSGINELANKDKYDAAVEKAAEKAMEMFAPKEESNAEADSVHRDSEKKIVEIVNGCSCCYGDIRYPFWSMGSHAGSCIDVESAEIIRNDAQWLYVSVETMSVGFDTKQIKKDENRLIFKEDKFAYKLYYISDTPYAKEKFLDTNFVGYDQAIKAYEILKKKILTEDAEKNNDVVNNTRKGKKSLRKKIPSLSSILSLIALVMFICAYFHSYNNQNDAKQATSSQSAIEQQVNTSASQTKAASEPVKEEKEPEKPKPPVEPIARADVITGYDMEWPILNDSGYSELTIDNSRNNMPVYVRVWDMDYNTPVRAFYINKGDMFTAENMAPGRYEVRYIELYDNDFPAEGSKSEPLELEEFDTGYGIRYSQYTLTLYKVRNGNTTTTKIPADSI